eukprot:TRINITY_DN7144_c0_g1_i2.p1 TRINITY_DN7144_c0_g1~~TRINITY_DN7144_c0_g1_i2.p1  ORF type:complete len:1087 (+),score=126.63 TRINITY_DN7144_c0_g1_i2:455-3262(+)
MVLLGRQALLVEPSHGLRAGRMLRDTTGTAPHSVRRLQEEVALDMFGDVQSYLAPAGHEARRLAATVTKYVEVVVVNDFSRYTAFGGQSGLAALSAHSSGVINTVTSIYRNAPVSGTFPFQIQVVLVAQHTFLKADPWESAVNMIGSETEVNSLLGEFLGWTSKEMSAGVVAANDNRILLSGRDFDGSTVGYAGVSAMCNVARSGGVNMCGNSLASIAGCSATVAHEMGHNLGMSHDGSDNGCATSGNIMEAVGGGPTPDRFSSCSVNYITTFFNEVYPQAACLENRPTRVFGDPVCQNGFVEAGEDCDCGGADCSTLDPCCNGATCAFAKATYQCSDASQGCCQNCMNISASANHVCRPGSGSCDLPEICPGGTGDCPKDVYAYPGQACNASPDIPCVYATSSTECPSFRCTWTGTACQDSSNPWEGPLATDIPGMGFASYSAASLDACKQNCINNAACVAIQYSPTDTHSGFNCFVFTTQADTGAQYSTFQIYKLHQAKTKQYAGLCSLGTCMSMDYTCSVNVNRDFAGSWDMSDTCAEFNDDCKQMICHKGEHPNDPNQCGQNFAVHDKQMPVPDGTPCWHPSTPKGNRTGLCQLGKCTLPHVLAVVPNCGNGGIDYGEQCDCGNAADPCCDCNTCQLRSGYQCSSHEACCDSGTCMFKASGTVCRAAFDACDDAETCTGTSGRCPLDVGKAMGASCPGASGLNSTCYGKRCVSDLNSQCRQITGGARPFARYPYAGIHPRFSTRHECTALDCCGSCGEISGRVSIDGVAYQDPWLCNSCEKLMTWSTFTVVQSDGSSITNTIYLGATVDGTVLQDENQVCIRSAAVARESSCSSNQYLEASVGRCLQCDSACSACTGPTPFDCVGACAHGYRDSRGACPISAEQAFVGTGYNVSMATIGSLSGIGSGQADDAQASSFKISALIGTLCMVLA